MREAKSISCIHSFPVWLPLTQTWMYTQFQNLPKECEKHVVCATTQNLDQYGVENLHKLAKETEPSNPIYRKIKFGLNRVAYPGFLKKKIDELNADIVHSHFGPIGVRNLKALKSSNAAHIVTFYGADVTETPVQKPRYKGLYKKMFREIDLVLCEGPHMASIIVEQLGCPEEKIKVQRLGIEMENLPYVPRKWDGNGPIRFLIAGTFREKKGIPYALKAISKLDKDIPFEITIYGDATLKPGDQSEKKNIMDILRKENLTSKTTLKGFRLYQELLEDAYRHHVFISPSVTAKTGDTEGGAPVTLIEMAASGIPILSTHHCDIPGVVIDGKSGWLAAERDVEGLYQHLDWLIKHSNKWEPFLASGRKHVEEKFNSKIQGKKLFEIYNSCLKS